MSEALFLSFWIVIAAAVVIFAVRAYHRSQSDHFEKRNN